MGIIAFAKITESFTNNDNDTIAFTNHNNIYFTECNKSIIAFTESNKSNKYFYLTFHSINII
jgi:hypothetical protein